MKHLLFSLVLLGGLIGQGCLLGDRPHPSDDKLVANFEANEAEFNRLIEMCKEDSNMTRIADDFLWRVDHAGWPRAESDWGITRERWNEYKKLFKKVGLDNGLVNQGKIILLFANNRGLLTGGSSKGYAYLSEPPRRTFDSLDHSDDHEGIDFRPLKGNWYLYFERN